jgi:hypothetical protein
MAIDMRKTPSYLKGLAETRARAAGALQRHEQQKSELEALLPQLEADLERYRGGRPFMAGIRRSESALPRVRAGGCGPEVHDLAAAAL